MQLTQQQAYLAMFAFLDAKFSKGWLELGVILGSMSLLDDGSPADQAFAADWDEAVQAAMSGNVDAGFKLNP